MRTAHPKFELVSSQTLNLPQGEARLDTYIEVVSGMQHRHLDFPGTDEQSFCLGLPSFPVNDKGLPHVLEHLVLCGSQKFPVRDPFFKMLRRSIAHEMNASTYPDRTTYYFSTTNDQDFLNLADVYVDAVFHPLLRELDFRQEGWRFELVEGKPTYQGVVFNEMKGSMAQPRRRLFRDAFKLLFPGTPYALNSGGDPLEVAKIDYQELLDFWKLHYHPTQSRMVTTGPVDVNALHALVIASLEARPDLDAQPHAPLMLPALASNPAQREAISRLPSTHDKEGVVAAWRLDGSSHEEDTIANFVITALANRPDSPLGSWLTNHDQFQMGSFTGLSSYRQSSVTVAIENLNPGQADEALAELTEVIAGVVANPPSVEYLTSVFDQMAFDERDEGSSGAGKEYGMDIVHSLLSGKPVEEALEDHLTRLRPKLIDPAFFASWIRDNLDPTQRLTLRTVPNPNYTSEQAEMERAQLAQIVLSDEDKREIERTSNALKQAQMAVEKLDDLPLLALDAIYEPKLTLPKLDRVAKGHWHVAGGAPGIARMDLFLDVSELSPDERRWAALLVSLATDMKSKQDADWEASVMRRSTMAAEVDDVEQISDHTQGSDHLVDLVGWQVAHLEEKADQLAAVLEDFRCHLDLNDTGHYCAQIEDHYENMKRNLTSLLEKDVALRSKIVVASGERHHQISGVALLNFLEEVVAMNPDDVRVRLEKMYAMLQQCPTLVMTEGGDQIRQQGQAFAERLFDDKSELPEFALGQAKKNRIVSGIPTSVISGPTPVQYVYTTYHGPTLLDKDYAAIKVAARWLSNNYLHRAVREQGGAYGSGARVSSGLIEFSSYRDPRLAETFADFERALNILVQAPRNEEDLHEIKLQLVGKSDALVTESAKASKVVNMAMADFSEHAMLNHRTDILNVSWDDMVEAAQKWLGREPAIKTALVSDQLTDVPFQVYDPTRRNTLDKKPSPKLC